MVRTLFLLGSLLAVGFLPLSAQAGGVWRVEITDAVAEETPAADGWLSSLRLWLSGKSNIPRLPIGTTFTIHSSAYASSPYQTDSTPCITAAGTRVRPGIVASNFLPMGTILEINDERYIVEDRMNPRYNGRFVDIWFPSTEEALEFGRKQMEATIVEYGTVGQELVVEEEVNPIKPSVLKRASLRFVAFTRAIARAIPANVNQYDVNCFE
jgi:3D (Asp-Asp-Asp) domain-containing protein